MEEHMDQLFITDLTIRGIIGINERERRIPQKICINLALFGDLASAGRSDDIRDSVNYKSVARKVLAHVRSARRFAVEALAADIAALCLEDSWVSKVRVRVEKPGALRFARSVGAEIERSRE
jgi:FolB domain-containing protein